jgi:hypothetical protein
MVSYAFYENTYLGGSVPEEEWPGYERRAAAQLARYKRLYTVVASSYEGESMAICAMAEALLSFDLIANGEGGVVQSTAIGSVSVSYGSTAGQAVDISAKGQAAELYSCASLYLDIYRGCGPC